MRNASDVLILGGGVIGVCCAFFSQQQGRSVTILDKQDICAGSSYGNAGLVVPSHAVPLAMPGAIRQALPWLLDASSPFYIKPRLDPALLEWLLRFRAASTEKAIHRAIPLLIELNRASLGLFRELAARPDLSFSFEERGGLYVYNTLAGMEKGVHEAERLAHFGLKSAILDAQAVHHMAPVLRAPAVGGIFYAEDAHLVPDRFVHGMAEIVRRQGGEIHGSTEVLTCETLDHKVQRVVTTRGDYYPKQVVLALGAWSPQLEAALRLRLPVQAAKGYSITIPRPATAPAMPLHLAERKVAVTPMGTNLRFAGTLELAGIDLTINRRRVNAIQQAAYEYLNLNADITAESNSIEIWRGLRPLTPDTLPIIGRSRHLKNLTVATGHGMMGVSMGPITGKLVAQLVTEQAPEIALSLLSLERFA
jgi:D-amino-acid dehydrogenase